MECESATKRGEIKQEKKTCIDCLHLLMREEKMDQSIAVLEIRGGLTIERFNKYYYDDLF